MAPWGSTADPKDIFQSATMEGACTDAPNPDPSPWTTWLRDNDYHTIVFIPSTQAVADIQELVKQQLTFNELPPCPDASTGFNRTWATGDEADPSTVAQAKVYRDACLSATNFSTTFYKEEGIESCKCLEYKMASAFDDAEVKDMVEAETLAVVVEFKGTLATSAGVQEAELRGLGKLEYELRLPYNLPLGETRGDDVNPWQTQSMFPEWRDVSPIPSIEIPYLGQAEKPNGFVYMQAAINHAIATYLHPTRAQPDAIPRMKSMPFPSYEEDNFLGLVTGLFPFLLVLVFSYPAMSVARELVIEKEDRLREAMQLMGLTPVLNWIGWALKWFFLLTFLSLLLTLVFWIGKLLRFSNPFVVFLLIEFLTFALIGFGFMMSTFFSTASVASAVTVFIWIFLGIPYWVTAENFGTLSSGAKHAVCLSPPSCFSAGFRIISYWERRGEGVTLTNMSESVSDGNEFTLSHVIGMLLLDTILLLVFTWYFDKVIPNKYGIPKSPFFCFSKAYWFGDNEEQKRNMVAESSTAVLGASNSAFEPVPEGLEVGIRADAVVKAFSTPAGTKVAVDKLSLDIFKGQVTALLGHNGAGKTTFMSMICGMFPPSDGTITLDGHNVATHTEAARESLGLCPQFDILFRQLTVTEHLKFYLGLKGVTDKAEVQSETEKFIRDVDLWPKRDARSNTLSGGQKRALSVAIALIGGSKTVVLDEPTSGMDPQKRRLTWDLIIKHKQDRTILFTTHFMDEADLLGERIAIMSDGKLSTVGTSRFLKDRFGIGYRLTFSKGPNFNDGEVNGLVRRCTPNCKVDSDVGTELAFVVPKSDSAAFPELFKALEKDQATLGYDSYGCSCSTMEEVFLKIGQIELDKRTKELETEGDKVVGATTSKLLAGAMVYKESLSAERNTGCSLWLQQFKALFYKRAIHSSRFLAALFAQTVLPAIFVFLGLGIIKWAAKPPTRAAPCMNLGLSGDNMHIADISRGFDSYSDMTADITENLRLLGEVGPNANQTAMFDSMKSSAALYGVSTTENQDTNFTATLLEAEDGYAKSRFWSKNFAAGSVSTGRIWLKDDEASDQCSWSSSRDGSYQAFPNNELKLREGTWYTLLSADAVDPSSAQAAWETCANTEITTGNKTTSACFKEREVCKAKGDKAKGDCMATFWQYYKDLRECQMLYSYDDSKSNQVPLDVFDLQKCIVKTERCGAYPISCVLDEQKDTGGFGIPDNETTDEFVRDVLSVSNRDSVYFVEQSAPSDAEKGGDQRSCGKSCGKKSWIKSMAGAVLNVTLTCGTSELNVIQAAVATDAFDPPGLTVLAWYSRMAYHGVAQAVNLAGSAIALNHLRDFGVTNLHIVASNCPLPKTTSDSIETSSGSDQAWNIAFFMSLGIAFLGAGFLLFPVAERNGNAKHIQFVSGADEYVYWLSAFCWDMCNMVAPFGLLLIVFAGFDVEAYRGDRFGYMALLIALGLPAILPMNYNLSFLFKTTSMAYAVSILLVWFFSYASFITVYILMFPQFSEKVNKAGEILHYIFLFNPVYAIVHGLVMISDNYYLNKQCAGDKEAYCEESDVQYQKNYLAWGHHGIGKNLVWCVIDLVFYGLILFLIEYLARQQKKSNDEVYNRTEDEDVMNERNRIEKPSETEDQLIVRNLSKQFSTGSCGCGKPVLAVNNLSFGVPRGQCFGLLGVNGAGKTSTFRMLTGDVTMSQGEITVDNLDLRTNLREIRQRIGYCPQYNGLVNTLTGREMLFMFGRLRGIPEQNLPGAVEELIEQLDLTNHANRLSGTYSGGNKRKLSTALALIGAPSLVFLDEPTSGMDPEARRFLWNVLASVVASGKSIILTSHSMEECEALCTRLTIMKDGRFECMGTPQHLKSRFGQGFAVIAKIDAVAANMTKSSAVLLHEFKEMLKTDLPAWNVQAEYGGEVTLTVPASFKLSTLFSTMEQLKERFAIQDYSVSQTTLEQIFVAFATNQWTGDVTTHLAAASDRGNRHGGRTNPYTNDTGL